MAVNSGLIEGRLGDSGDYELPYSTAWKVFTLLVRLKLPEPLVKIPCGKSTKIYSMLQIFAELLYFRRGFNLE